MPNSADNLAVLIPPASIARTHGFAAAVDRRATWGEQIATRWPLGLGGASVDLVHRFTGMGASAIGPWAARLAERYNPGERAVERTSDLPLASSPAPRRVARTASASAWAPQQARDPAETRVDHSAPDLARSFASDLSARGWPVQTDAEALPSARSADMIPPALTSAAAVNRAAPTLDVPSPSARPPSEPSAASTPPAEIGRLRAEASAPPTVSRSAESAQPLSDADAAPVVSRSVGPAMPAAGDTATQISQGVTERIPAMPANAPAVARQAEAGGYPATVGRAAPAVSPALAVSGASRSEAPLALPLVAQRSTALMRQARPDPLARMGFRTAQPPQEPAAHPGVSAPSVLARSAALTPTAPAAPTEPAQSLVEQPAEESSPAAGSTSAQPPEQHFAGNEASAPAPISAEVNSPPPAVAARPLPDALAASIAQRLAAPTSATVAQLPALRTWATAPLAAPRGSDTANSGFQQNSGMSVSGTPPVGRAAALAPLARPAIVPSATMGSAAQTYAPADLSQEPAAPAQSRLEPPAEQVEWGALPLVRRALEHTGALSASAAATSTNLPSQIVGRQAAFAPAALVASANAASQAAQRAPDQAEAPAVDRIFASPLPQIGTPTTVVEPLGMAPAGQVGGGEREAWLTPELPLRDRPSERAESSAYIAQRIAAELPLATRGAARSAEPPGSPATYLRELGGSPELDVFPSALQRAPALDSAASLVPAGNSSAPAPGAAPATGNPPIDELARKVYDYLRRELRIEQERAGWRTW